MNTLETVATILIALPALLYAGAFLFRTEDMVAMLSKRIPGIRVLVRGLDVRRDPQRRRARRSDRPVTLPRYPAAGHPANRPARAHRSPVGGSR